MEHSLESGEIKRARLRRTWKPSIVDSYLPCAFANPQVNIMMKLLICDPFFFFVLSRAKVAALMQEERDCDYCVRRASFKSSKDFMQ
jgi:hypothetical protein